MFTFQNKCSAAKTRLSVPSTPQLQKSKTAKSHLKITKTTSILTSIKSTNHAIFTTFHTIKNPHSNTKNPIKPLKIKHFFELNQNPIFSNKTTPHKISKFNRKISQTPVKSTLLLSNTNQNFTLLSKSKNLSHHETHNEHNQKITVMSIIKRE